MKNKKNKSKGYTLIEVVVAVGIFFIIIAAPIGFFVGSLRGQQRALSSQEVLNEISYALEYVSRALRMAEKDFDGSCIAAYKNYEETTQRYYLSLSFEGPGIKFNKTSSGESECWEIFNCSNLSPPNRLFIQKEGGFPSLLTSDDLEITSLNIKDGGWEQTDTLQPKTTLFLEIKGKRSNRPELQPVLKIQTTVSQRNLDVEY